MSSPEFSKRIDKIKLTIIGASMAALAITGCTDTKSNPDERFSTTTVQASSESYQDDNNYEEKPVTNSNVDKFVSEAVAPKLPELFEYIYSNPGQAVSAERDTQVRGQSTYRSIRIEGDNSFELFETTDESGKLISFSYQQIIPGSRLDELERDGNTRDLNPEGDIRLNDFYLFLKTDGKYGITAVIDEKQVSTELIQPLDWGERTYPSGRVNDPIQALEYSMSMLEGLVSHYPEFNK